MSGHRPRMAIIETDVVQIYLTKGYVALVDRADWDAIPALRDDAWAVWRNKHGRHVYALRDAPPGDPTLMHRLILQPPPGMVVNHRSFDGLDNRRCNIEVCSHAENVAFQRVHQGAKSSVFKGVYWNAAARKWRARIQRDRQQIYLGRFDHEEDAARAYNRAASELFGRYAVLNEISGEAIPGAPT